MTPPDPRQPPAPLAQLLALAGQWSGEGRTAEGASFRGRLELVPVVEGRGVALLYRAEALPGEPAMLHVEDTLCATLPDGSAALFVLCLELAGVQVLRHRPDPRALVFDDGQTRIRIDRDGEALGYTWARHGPGGWRDLTAVRVERAGGGRTD